MPEQSDSISFNNVNPIDTFNSAIQQANKTKVSKEQIKFVSNNTDIKALEQYLKMVNDMLEKKENNGFLAKFRDAVLSLFGCESASRESIEALKTLIVERINQLRYTA